MRETGAGRPYGRRQRLSLAAGVSLSVSGLLSFRTDVTVVGCTLLLVGLASLLSFVRSRRHRSA
ncbi:hypothetical protein [Modestobacter sp. SSW1-42]|uniref:hypothetical protein n=1 Tax=Modestobacter sp. SSW1-42 TaxID=596372 RepID=UPI0039886791